MALESGFFNSSGGDRKYSAEQMSRYFENILSSGIFKRIPDCLKVTAGGGMALTITPGAGLIDCHWFRAKAAETVTIPTAHAVLPRIDNVVARLDLSESVRAITLQVVQGTPAEVPAAIAPTRTESKYDLVLARVLVPAGASAISAGNITDTREDETICGFVHSLVDTPVLKSFNSRYIAVANNTTVAPINIVGYNAAVDLLNVYINGFRVAPGVEYTINAATNSITLLEAVDAGTVVDFEAQRPMMPDEVPNLAETVADMAQTITTLQADITALQADTDWIDLEWAAGISSSDNWKLRIRRVGKSIFLRGLAMGVNAIDMKIATIPEGFRPVKGGHAWVGYCSRANNTRAARLFIEETGEVIVRSTEGGAPVSGDVISVSTSWLID